MGCYPPLDKIVSKALGKCNGAYRALSASLVFVCASVLIAGSSRLLVLVIKGAMLECRFAWFRVTAMSKLLPRSAFSAYCLVLYTLAP